MYGLLACFIVSFVKSSSRSVREEIKCPLMETRYPRMFFSPRVILFEGFDGVSAGTLIVDSVRGKLIGL